MEEEKTKVSHIESYLLKRVKQLEKENKARKAEKEQQDSYLKKNYDTYISVREELERLQGLCKELANFFEIRTDESDRFDFSYFNGSYLHVINKTGDIDKCDKALIDFLNYVKENL